MGNILDTIMGMDAEVYGGLGTEVNVEEEALGWVHVVLCCRERETQFESTKVW